MDRNEADIREAIADLGLSEEDIAFCDPGTAAWVVDCIKRAFLREGDPRWWWAWLRVPGTKFPYQDSKGYLHVQEHVPQGEARCWFIVENDDDGPWHVLDAKIGVVPRVLEECGFFEYYLVGKAFDWMVADNHHNEIVVASAAGSLKR